MADVAQPHQKRSWYKRPLVWIVFVVLAALIIFGIREAGGGPATIRYSDFLNQLDAGNIVNVTFSGTQIDGHFKRPVVEKNVNNGAPLTVFRSQAPAFGDPTLLPELRKVHVAIGVGSSQLLGAGIAAALGIVGAFLLAKPILLVIAAAFIAGLVRVARGGKMDIRSILSMLPMFRAVSPHNGKEQQSDEDSSRAGNS